MKHKGFTLIELLVVISIIGILTTLIVNNLSDTRARARDSRRKSDLTQLKTSLRLYYNDNQKYPTSDQLPDASDPPVEFTSADGNTVYMQQLPTEFSYESAGGDAYLLKVTLENASDPDLPKTQAACLGAADDSLDFYVCAN